MGTFYERLGGEAGLREIVSQFIAKVYADPIIGFFFVDVDQAQLIEREIEFAGSHLGGPQIYLGRGMRQIHRPRRINTGHFHRRLWILETLLEDRGVDPDIIENWISHDKRLQRVVTTGKDCAE